MIYSINNKFMRGLKVCLVFIMIMSNSGCDEGSSYSQTLSAKDLSVEMHVSKDVINGSLQTGESVYICAVEQCSFRPLVAITVMLSTPEILIRLTSF